MKNEDSVLLGVKDLMRTFHISRRTVYLWIEKGVFSPIKIEGTLRFHSQDIQQLIERHRAEGAAFTDKKKILAVDDDILVRESLKSLLTRQGYTVSVLPGGQEAVDHLTNSDAQYDLVITDVRMSGMDGIQMLQRLRRIQEEKERPPFGEIVITAYSDPSARRQAKALGIRHFLMKPFDIEYFYKKIQEVLSVPSSLSGLNVL